MNLKAEAQCLSKQRETRDNFARCSSRKAFSLFEVVLALAIFGIAMAMLGNIVSNGATAAIEARDLARAQIMCESKMAEVMLNPAGPQPIPDVTLESNDTLRQWQYSVASMPAPMAGMVAVTVKVASVATDPSIIPVQYSLTRWIIDPSMDLQGMEDEAAAVAAEDDESTMESGS